MLTPTKLQEEDSDYLLRYEHGYVWSLPGTGKTLTTLLAIRKAGWKRLVVIAPTLALTMWGEEIEEELGMSVQVIRKGRTKIKEADAYVTTYQLATNEGIRKNLENFLELGSSVIVLDESHYVKSRDAKRSKALVSPVGRTRPVKHGDEIVQVPATPGAVPGMVTKADYMFQLTGTPITRYPDDLWMQLRHGRADVLKAYGVLSYPEFVREFCLTRMKQFGYGRPVEVVVGAKNEERMNKMLKDCCVVRRTLSEAAAELPPITYQRLDVQIAPTKVKIGDLGELERFLNDPDSPYAKAYRELGEAKVKALPDDVFDGMNKPMLIGYWHKKVGNMLAERLRDNVFGRIDGSTSAGNRDMMQKSFNEGKLPFLLGQMSALNVSYNLQGACSTVFVVEQLPSPGMLDQFVARVYRKGQQKHVQVYELSSQDDLDKALSELRRNKEAINRKVIG